MFEKTRKKIFFLPPIINYLLFNALTNRMEKKESPDVIIVDIYKLTKLLHHGEGLEIFKGVNIKTKKEVAIKFEPINTKCPRLFFECKLLQYLSCDPSFVEKGIPKIIQCYSIGDFKIMVMELYGPSLEELFSVCQRKFSLKTVLMLADQMLQSIEYIHLKNFLHRYLEPSNFVMGAEENANKVYLIDYGRASRFKWESHHIGYVGGMRHYMTGNFCIFLNLRILGVPRYSSIDSHTNNPYSWKDDLESLGYILLYFLRGSLPWQKLKEKDKMAKHDMIGSIKKNTSTHFLCKGLPSEFSTYLSYCKKLKIGQRPAYKKLRTLFKNLFTKLGYEWDYDYDWYSLIPKPSNSSTPIKEEQNEKKVEIYFNGCKGS